MSSTVRVAAVQMSADLCYSEKEFKNRVASIMEQAKKSNAEVAIFPEDLGFMLAFCREAYRVENIKSRHYKDDLKTLSLRTWLERLVDSVL